MQYSFIRLIPPGLSQHRLSQRWLQRWGMALASVTAILLPLGQFALAGDPFRTEASPTISETSEQMFYAMFRDGNYVEARQYLDTADADARQDPMLHAMGAAFYYLDEDWEGLKAQALKTQEAAIAITATDPLRGNLYEAVGIFMEGAHLLQTEGIAQGTPRALRMLQQVLDRMDKAENIDPTDPELSLLKGYMDLLLAVNLPFSDPEQAISRLETHGNPDYVAYRGIALGYRDLGRNEAALDAIDTAIAAAPENPDLFYLKAQILRRLDRNGESVTVFGQALQYADQLPLATTLQIAIEQCQANGGRRSTCKEAVREVYAPSEETVPSSSDQG